MYEHICEDLPRKVNLVKETEKQREKRKSKKEGNGDQRDLSGHLQHSGLFLFHITGPVP